MSEKSLEILADSRTSHRLTITPTRITIKHRIGALEKENAEILKFFLKIAEKMENVDKAYRGKMTSTNSSITLYTDSRKSKKTFKSNFYDC